VAGLSKLNSVSRLQEPASRSTLFQASRVVRTAREPSNGSDAYRSKSSGIP